jgi:pyroglutamyl-peptidase
MKTVILTGFEPFGGNADNPSGAIVRELDGVIIAEHEVIGAVLPCVFGRATAELSQLIKLHAPSLVVCLGLAAGRTSITPERIAINLADAPIPDNDGRQPIDEPIVSDGPAAYWSTLPVKAIVTALLANGIQAEVSLSAGAFVCNHVFYGLMHRLAKAPYFIRGGFIHVPSLPMQPSEQPGMLLVEMIEGIHLAIETSLTLPTNVRGGEVEEGH